MQLLVGILVTIVQWLLRLTLLAMLVKAIMSWVMPDENNRFSELLTLYTELFVAPFRALFDRIDFLRMCPIDLSFSAACLVLWLISALLPQVSF